MGRAFSSASAFSNRAGTVDIWVEYQDNNLRIRTLNWNVPEGVFARVRIWEGGTLSLDKTINGPETDSMNVPGNRNMVEVTDSIGTYLDFPTDITYVVQISNQPWL